MTKVYCDNCGYILPNPQSSSRIFTLSEKPGEIINSMSTPWTVAIKVERNVRFDLCQHCLDDVMERAWRLFMERRSTKKEP